MYLLSGGEGQFWTVDDAEAYGEIGMLCARGVSTWRRIVF